MEDLTFNSREGSLSESDCGGRLGPFIDGNKPDLRNLDLKYVELATNDLLFLMSDGVHDNLEPYQLGISPKDLGFQVNEWKEIPEAEHIKAKYRADLLTKMITSMPENERTPKDFVELIPDKQATTANDEEIILENSSEDGEPETPKSPSLSSSNSSDSLPSKSELLSIANTEPRRFSTFSGTPSEKAKINKTLTSRHLGKYLATNSEILEERGSAIGETGVLKEGFLVKKGHIRRNWKTRYFVLRPGSLSYYPSQMYSEREKLGVINLTDPGITLTKGNGHDKKFTIRLPSKEYEIYAPTSQERDSWLRCIREVLEGKSGVTNITMK